MAGKKRTTLSKRLLRTVPIVAGTGLLALDVVIADTITAEPRLCAGGTCGNVLTALSYLGWQAYPIARLRSDAASKRITDDLVAWGVKLDFISLDSDGSTPVIVQHIRRNKAGEPSHSFSRKCPKCGTWLPWYKAVLATNTSDIAKRLPTANLFYFDRTSRGAVSLARHAFDSGCMVVFEPSAASDAPLLKEALDISHIVKIASDRLAGNEGVLDATHPTLVVETLGANGLRFRQRTAKGIGTWRNLPALKGATVVDAAGAGDWCTAGLLSRLGLLTVDELQRANNSVVADSLRLGQAMAAWACTFHGARGGMYESTKSEFAKSVESILKGRLTIENSQTEHSGRKSHQKPIWCNRCLAGSRPKRLTK